MLDPLDHWKEPIVAMVVQNHLSSKDPLENMEMAVGQIRSGLDDDDVDIVVLPELFATGFERKAILNPDRISSRINESMEDISTCYRVNLIYSMPYRDNGSIYNRAFLMDREGRIKGHYDKTHLFSRSGEDRLFSPGGSLRVFEIEGLPIGIVTCYEIRYPELALSLARSGAGVILNPAQWPDFRISQWTTLLRARAIENQLFVIGANITGNIGNYSMGGHSCIVEPFGEPAGSLGGGPGILKCTLDPNKISSFRKKIRMADDRREIDRIERIEISTVHIRRERS
ncbi:MAG: nitrilase-related carbon-nitrogen hydrolase [Candidatus Thermoplasmatota archaeon]|nr:nitrilase-related carbon-nitrogen hydrolase [Candidatus Thermoplasmatota archaeon]